MTRRSLLKKQPTSSPVVSTTPTVINTATASSLSDSVLAAIWLTVTHR